jgi:hypothetical protein
MGREKMDKNKIKPERISNQNKQRNHIFGSSILGPNYAHIFQIAFGTA